MSRLLAATFGLLLTTCSTSTAAAAPNWSFDPASWDFGVVVPETGPTSPKAFTLTNTGDVELRTGFVSVEGSEGAGFNLAGNTCGKLSPGGSCTIGVSFNPSTPGPKDGQLQVLSQGGVAPAATVGLVGTGAGPEVSLDQYSLRFPVAVLGEVTPPQPLTLTNTGAVDLTISWIAPVTHRHGGDSDVFNVSGGTCSAGSILPPDGSCTVGVRFAPTRSGHMTTDLLISSDALDSPEVVILEGDGIAPVSALAPFIGPFIPPRAAIVQRPAKRTFRRQAAFWLRGSLNAAHFACKLDDQQGLEVCDSPVRYRRLRTGPHRFLVRAIDAMGRGGAIKEFKWTIVDRKVATRRD